MDMLDDMLDLVRELAPAREQEFVELAQRHPPKEGHSDGTSLWNGCIDATGQVYIDLAALESRGQLLALYLHEVTHAELLFAGYSKWTRHDDAFFSLCHSLQFRFGIQDFSNFDYDTQDAEFVEHSFHKGRRYSELELSAELIAQHLTRQEREAKRQQSRMYKTIIGGILAILLTAYLVWNYVDLDEVWQGVQRLGYWPGLILTTTMIWLTFT